MPNPKIIEKQIVAGRAKKNAAATKAGAKKHAKAKAAPASVRAKNLQTTISDRITDADRLNTFVVSVLEKWRLAKESNLDGSDQNIIKVSMREINLVMSRTLKNTRVSRLHDLINDTLSGLDIADVYGSWVFVDWDSPDCLFIRLPDTKTNVVRVRVGRKMGSEETSMVARTEQLIEHGFGGDDEDEDLPVKDDGDIDREYDGRPEDVRKTEKLLRTWTLDQLQDFVIENKVEVSDAAFSNYEQILAGVLAFKTKQA